MEKEKKQIKIIMTKYKYKLKKETKILNKGKNAQFFSIITIL